ncbi:hypothetical protein P3T42_005492 [Paraburkholderia sp. GAS38]
MVMNIQRQPKLSIMAVSSGAASPVPRYEAHMKMPVAEPRSRTANQSLTTRAAAGNCGASPMPSSARAAANCAVFVTRPHNNCALDQTASPQPSSQRGP